MPAHSTYQLIVISEQLTGARKKTAYLYCSFEGVNDWISVPKEDERVRYKIANISLKRIRRLVLAGLTGIPTPCMYVSDG